MRLQSKVHIIITPFNILIHKGRRNFWKKKNNNNVVFGVKFQTKGTLNSTKERECVCGIINSEMPVWRRCHRTIQRPHMNKNSQWLSQYSRPHRRNQLPAICSWAQLIIPLDDIPSQRLKKLKFTKKTKQKRKFPVRKKCTDAHLYSRRSL